MRSQAFALVSVVVTVMAWASAGSAQVADHLQCYRVTDSAQRTTYVADLDGLAPAAGCMIRLPAKYLCVDTTKTNVQPAPSGGGPGGQDAGTFLCYALRCPRATHAPAPIADQFGSRTVVPGASRLLCAPAGTPTTSTTSTSSTTVNTSTSSTTSTMPVCGTPDASGFCGGPCPAGETCAAIDSSTCGCVATGALCTTLSSQFTCGTNCPRVTDSCIFVMFHSSPTCLCVTFCGTQSGFECPNDPACPPGLTCNPGIGSECTCS
jgi:hypothetical protein